MENTEYFMARKRARKKKDFYPNNRKISISNFHRKSVTLIPLFRHSSSGFQDLLKQSMHKNKEISN